MTVQVTIISPPPTYLHMSDRDYKGKRSVQDSAVDLSKMRRALNRLEAVKEDGMEETKEEL